LISPSLWEVLEAPLRCSCVIGDVVEIAFGHDAECADRRKSSTLGAVDLVDPVARPNQFTLVAPRQIEILREYVARIGFFAALTFVDAAAASIE